MIQQTLPIYRWNGGQVWSDMEIRIKNCHLKYKFLSEIYGGRGHISLHFFESIQSRGIICTSYESWLNLLSSETTFVFLSALLGSVWKLSCLIFSETKAKLHYLQKNMPKCNLKLTQNHQLRFEFLWTGCLNGKIYVQKFLGQSIHH